MTNRQRAGVAFLVIGGLLAAVGAWRAYVRIAGNPDDYVLVALMGSAAEDVPPAKQEEVHQKIVDRGRKAEGAAATGCLVIAGALAVAGYRRLTAPSPAGPNRGGT